MKTARPVLHGVDHKPGGPDPAYTGPWHYVGDSGEPSFISGSNAAATVAIPEPVPLRFRLAVGPPNVLDVDTGAVVRYTEHQVELQGDLIDLDPGDTVFNLPAQYRHSYDVPVHGHDDNGDYVPCRLFANGDFVYGVP